MPKIRFPYGISNIEQLITQGYYFVDKTAFIEKLEERSEKFISFLRPRRIGKSLFVSILEYYYGKEYQAKFNQIFGKLYIGKNPTPLQGKYAVLTMDFSGIDTQTEESSYRGFLVKVRSYLHSFMIRYELFDEAIKNEILSQASPDGVMTMFFNFYLAHFQETPIYLIIDEYDHFTNEILLQDLSQFKKAVTQNGYVRKFYETIKEATRKNVVDRVFITGVAPITLDSLTSGFNIITHLTHHIQFHDMMGFTTEEVGTMLDLILEDKTRKENIMQDLKEWYNGYKFRVEAKTTLYNSDMVLYFMLAWADEQAYPKPMLDPNIAPDYGKVKRVFEIQNPKGNYEVLEKIIRENEINNTLIFQFSFDKPFDETAFVSLLYYLGYLTLKEDIGAGFATFKIPNYVIKELYWEYFAYLITEQKQLPFNTTKLIEAMSPMALKGDISLFMSIIQEVLQTLSNRDFRQFDEKYIKMLIIAFALQSQIYYIRSEAENRVGYTDIEFITPPQNPNVLHEYIFEVKYLKKEQASQLVSKQEEAKMQIKKYLATDDFLKKRQKLHAYTIVVVKDEMFIDKVEND